MTGRVIVSNRVFARSGLRQAGDQRRRRAAAARPMSDRDKYSIVRKAHPGVIDAHGRIDDIVNVDRKGESGLGGRSWADGHAMTVLPDVQPGSVSFGRPDENSSAASDRWQRHECEDGKTLLTDHASPLEAKAIANILGSAESGRPRASASGRYSTVVCIYGRLMPRRCDPEFIDS